MRYHILIILALLSFQVLAEVPEIPYSSHPDRLSSFQKSIDLEAEGEVESAIKIWKNLVDSKPSIIDTIYFDAHINLVYAYQLDLNIPDSSSYYNLQYIDLCKKYGFHESAIRHCLLELNNELAKENLTKAIDWIFTSKQLLAKNKDKLEPTVYHYLYWLVSSDYGYILIDIDELEKARVECLKAYREIDYLEDDGDKLLSMLNVSATFDKGNPDSLLYYCQQGLPICEQEDPSPFCVNLYNNIVYGYSKKKEYQKGLDFFKSKFDLDKIPSYFDRMDLGDVYHTLGYIYHQLGDHEKAIPYYTDAYELSKEFEYPSLSSLCLTELIDIYEKKGKFQKALQFAQEKEKFEKQLEKGKLEVAVNQFEYNLRLEQKNQLITELTDENIDHEKRRYWLRVALSILGALLLIGFIFFYIREQESKMKMLELNDDISLAKFQSLTTNMNPHFIFNAFNTLQNFILKNQKEKAINYLSDFSGMIRNLLTNSDDISITLDEEIKLLTAYLHLESERFDNDIKFDFSIDESLKLENPNIPSMILQPHIENAIKHGFSSKKENCIISISLHKKGDGVYCQIEDNGIGRKKSAHNKNSQNHLSMASKNTKDRIAILKKLGYQNVGLNIEDLQYKSNHPLGTRVNITLPIFDKRKTNLKKQ